MQLRIRDKFFFAFIGIILVVALVGKLTGEEDGKEGNTGHEKAMIKLEIAQKYVDAEIVDNPATMRIGLSLKDEIADEEGMLFVHDGASQHPYIMNNMKFGLDILFIRGNKIVDIAKNVPADFDGKIVGGVEYDKVLEMNAGWTERNGVELGDEVKTVDSK